ncbi:MAG: SPFH domain-containing protein [Anaerolineae bacterium]
MRLRGLLMALTVVVILVAFAGFVLLALWEQPGQLPSVSELVTYFVLVIGLAVALYLGFQRVVRVFVQYVQAFHDLSLDEAEGLVNRLLYSSRHPGSMGVLLRVQAGQVDLDGPAVVHKVGGPAFLNVDHDSVVVTSRLGYLHRVLGPGGHPLEPFERVWDVVDLRPQRRTVVVDFMTRDGIPASCQATIVCSIAGPESVTVGLEHKTHNAAYLDYADDAILQVSTSKFVKRVDSGYRVNDWVVGMSGALESVIRDTLEQYTLDEFLNPQYWLEEDEGRPRSAAAPKLVSELEEAIERDIKAVGRERGVSVIRVEMGTVRPAEEAISRQWLEFWQAKLQKRVDRYAMQAEVTRAELAVFARVEVRVDFLNRVLERLQSLHGQGIDIPGELVVSTITEVLQTMHRRGSETERALYPSMEKVESLARAVKIIQADEDVDALDDVGSEQAPSLTVDED